MGRLIPREFTQSNQGKMSFFLMAGISLFILWSAPIATALYYGTSSLWGALERKVLSRHTRRIIAAQIDLNPPPVTETPGKVSGAQA
jgi:YidC/Oxa1 family membrane protein insertase